MYTSVCNPLRISGGGGTTSEVERADNVLYVLFFACLIDKDVGRWKLQMLAVMVVFIALKYREEKREAGFVFLKGDTFLWYREPPGAWQGDQHQGVIFQKQIMNDSPKAILLKKCSQQHMFSGLRFHTRTSKVIFCAERKWKMVFRKLKRHPLVVIPQSSNSVVFGWRDMLTFPSLMCTPPPLWQTQHLCQIMSTMQSSRGGSSIVFKMEVYLPKHFAYSHEACRVNPAADASPIRKTPNNIHWQ